jgi:hypothetical protein
MSSVRYTQRGLHGILGAGASTHVNTAIDVPGGAGNGTGVAGAQARRHIGNEYGVAQCARKHES